MGLGICSLYPFCLASVSWSRRCEQAHSWPSSHGHTLFLLQCSPIVKWSVFSHAFLLNYLYHISTLCFLFHLNIQWICMVLSTIYYDFLIFGGLASELPWMSNAQSLCISGNKLIMSYQCCQVLWILLFCIHFIHVRLI